MRLERCKKFATAKELANAAGIEPRKYLKFEAGEQYRRLDRVELERISDCLKIPVELFADNTGHALSCN